MIQYQRKLLSDMSDVGSPGPLPGPIANLADADLANLPHALGPAAAELGFTNTGFFPVDVSVTPPSRRVISPLEFMQRIPEAKREAILQKADTPDFTLQVGLQMIQAAANGVDLDNQDTINLLAYAVSQNLLTADDVTAIRA